MKKNYPKPIPEVSKTPQDESFNEGLTARPEKKIGQEEVQTSEDDLPSVNFDYGKMNARDAKESGYTDENGKAVSMAVPDKKGHPTGAYTDVGEGRSSVVHKKSSHKESHSR